MALKPEMRAQIEVVQWVKKQQQLPPDEGYPPADRADLALLYATFNGLFTSRQQAFNAKRAGLRRGVPDLVLPAPRGRWFGLYIELKVGRGKPTKEQVEYLAALSSRGYRAEVAVGSAGAIALLEDYMAAPRLRVQGSPG